MCTLHLALHHCLYLITCPSTLVIAVTSSQRTHSSSGHACSDVSFNARSAWQGSGWLGTAKSPAGAANPNSNLQLAPLAPQTQSPISNFNLKHSNADCIIAKNPFSVTNQCMKVYSSCEWSGQMSAEAHKWAQCEDEMCLETMRRPQLGLAQ